MPSPRYRVLRFLLGFLSLLMLIAGVFLIFSSKALILRLSFHPPEMEISTLLVATVKEMGGLVVMVSVMLFLAARDPERNVAIVDGLIAGLCVLAATPLLSFYTLDLGKLYPAYAIWGRSLVRLGLAVWLYFLRPRGWRPAEHL